MPLETHAFGTLADGREARLIELHNGNGMSVGVTDLGASLVSVRVPDRRGGRPDVTLGFDGAYGYQDNPWCFGTTVGRCANRIAGATFELAGTTYRLAANEGANNLHSGPHAYGERLWKVIEAKGSSVSLNLLSRPGDQGFPGALNVTVTYVLDEGDHLRISYEALPSEATIVNLTCHAYWNLNGQASGSVLAHGLTIAADAYTPTDGQGIPTGEVAGLGKTPHDFRTGKQVGADIWRVPNGYDVNFVLRDGEAHESAATLVGERSGIAMDVTTSAPGLQLFVPGGLDCRGKDGARYQAFDAVALETQFFPDAIHHKGFPQPVFTPEHPFRSWTEFAFRTVG